LAVNLGSRFPFRQSRFPPILARLSLFDGKNIIFPEFQIKGIHYIFLLGILGTLAVPFLPVFEDGSTVRKPSSRGI